MPRIRLDQDPNATAIVIRSELRAAKEAETQILEALEAKHYPEACAFAIKLALEEAITNAIRHGSKNDRSKRLTLRYRITPDKAVISVEDEGAGFNPTAVPDPTLDENLNKPNGRGIMLMRAYMDEVTYNETGTEVVMVKHNR